MAGEPGRARAAAAAETAWAIRERYADAFPLPPDRIAAILEDLGDRLGAIHRPRSTRSRSPLGPSADEAFHAEVCEVADGERSSVDQRRAPPNRRTLRPFSGAHLISWTVAAVSRCPAIEPARTRHPSIPARADIPARASHRTLPRSVRVATGDLYMIGREARDSQLPSDDLSPLSSMSGRMSSRSPPRTRCRRSPTAGRGLDRRKPVAGGDGLQGFVDGQVVSLADRGQDV